MIHYIFTKKNKSMCSIYVNFEVQEHLLIQSSELETERKGKQEMQKKNIKKNTCGFYFWERKGIEQLLYNLAKMKFKKSWSKIFEIGWWGFTFFTFFYVLETVYFKIKPLQVT